MYLCDITALKMPLFSLMHVNVLILRSDGHIADHSFAYLLSQGWQNEIVTALAESYNR